jgi:hypothetical protein
LQERPHLVDENRNVRRFHSLAPNTRRERDTGAFALACDSHALRFRSRKAPSRRRR